MIIATGPLLLVQSDDDSSVYRQTSKKILFRQRSIAPKDLFRLADLGHPFDPGDSGLVLGIPGSKVAIAHAVSRSVGLGGYYFGKIRSKTISE
jgi:hypothetical protein